MKKNSFVDTNNSVSRPDGKYARVINEIAEHGVCPFCEENLSKYHKNPVEERKFWWVTDNMYPYTPTLHHRLIIHKKHIEHYSELSSEAKAELDQIFQDEMTKQNIDGGALVMRFGTTKYTGASVIHLHCHIVQSNPDDRSYDKSKGVIMRIG